jgi:hypothetical protein
MVDLTKVVFVDSTQGSGLDELLKADVSLKEEGYDYFRARERARVLFDCFNRLVSLERRFERRSQTSVEDGATMLPYWLEYQELFDDMKHSLSDHDPGLDERLDAFLRSIPGQRSAVADLVRCSACRLMMLILVCSVVQLGFSLHWLMQELKDDRVVLGTVV